MTQLLDPSGPYACIWDEEIDGCEIPEPQPLITVPNVSEQELLEFMFGKYQPDCELSCVDPAVIPLPPSAFMLSAAILVLVFLRKRFHV